MKILQVIDSLGRGGAETLVINVVKSLPQHDHFIITLYNINEFEEKLKEHGNVKILSFGSRNIKSFPKNIFKLKKAIASIQPDIVHSHLYWSNVITRLSTPKHIPLFFTNHSLQGHSTFSKSWLVWIERFTYKKRHTLISVSKTVEEEYNKLIGIKSAHFVLTNMADDIFFKGPKQYQPSKNLSFITIGRLHFQKNQAFLLKSFQHIQQHAMLDIYGNGPLKEDLESLKTHLNITNVAFKGTVTNLNERLPGYDVFIMSSIYEGYSVAVLEAMACGLPVILPNLPVFKEMGGNAAIYIDLNNEYSIKTEVEKLNSSYLAHLSRKSYEHALEVGSKKKYLEKLLRIYGVNN